MTRKSCTDTRPCQLTTCYGCARKLIDDLACHMLDQGASQDKVDAFRYPAINALASHVITVPAAPKAPKASKPPVLKHSEAYYRQIAKGLANATTTTQGIELLKDHAVADLNKIWSLTGRTDRIPSKLRKAERAAHMVECLVAYRLDGEAIRTSR